MVKQGNSTVANAIVWDNQERKGFVKSKLGQKGCQILRLEKKANDLEIGLVLQ